MHSYGTARKVKVLVADDYQLIREGLRFILNDTSYIQVTGEARDGAEAVKLARELNPDVVLMDVEMPGNISGLEATALIKESLPDVQIVMFTAHSNSNYVVEAVKAGAVGYVLKDASRELLCETIKNANAGHILIRSDILREALCEVMGMPKRIGLPVTTRVAPLNNELSERETKILQLVTEGQTNRQIGVNLSISEETVKKHIQHIITKMDAQDRTHAAVKAVRAGLVS
jgi:DNA-binding NarL/FixJ family response regulator